MESEASNGRAALACSRKECDQLLFLKRATPELSPLKSVEMSSDAPTASISSMAAARFAVSFVCAGQAARDWKVQDEAAR